MARQKSSKATPVHSEQYCQFFYWNALININLNNLITLQQSLKFPANKENLYSLNVFVTSDTQEIENYEQNTGTKLIREFAAGWLTG